jgi:hypothetical protein
MGSPLGEKACSSKEGRRLDSGTLQRHAFSLVLTKNNN